MAAQVAANVHCDGNDIGQSTEVAANSVDHVPDGNGDAPHGPDGVAPDGGPPSGKLKSPNEQSSAADSNSAAAAQHNAQDGGTGNSGSMNNDDSGVDIDPSRQGSYPHPGPGGPNQVDAAPSGPPGHPGPMSGNMPGYSNNFRGGYNSADPQQHGGPGAGNGPYNPGSNPGMGPQNHQYNQYGNYDGMSGMSGPRQGPYPPASKPMNMPVSRTSLSSAGAQMMPNYNTGPQQQHRFMSGPSTSQHSGPTPTLNQLLQSPSPATSRYGNSYPPSAAGGDYNMGKGPDGGNMMGSGQYPNQTWGSQQRTHPGQGAMGPAPPPNQTIGRTQGPMHEMNPQMGQKRPQPYGAPYANANPYSQQQGYGGQPYGQGSPPRYPGPPQGRMASMQGQPPQYGRQQMPPQYNQSGQQGMGGYNQQQQPPYYPQQQGQMGYQQQGGYPQGQQMPSQMQQLLTEKSDIATLLKNKLLGDKGDLSALMQNKGFPGVRSPPTVVPKPVPAPDEGVLASQLARPPSLPDLSGAIDDLPTGNEGTQNNSTPQLNNQNDKYNQPPEAQLSPHPGVTSPHPGVASPHPAVASPHPHPGVAGLRPSPSPVGSPGHLSAQSRSPMSPASGPGTSQMPPPTSQSDSMPHNQMNQSPMGPQERGGYHQQMPPPGMQGGHQMGSPMSPYGPQQGKAQMSPMSPRPAGQMHPGMGGGGHQMPPYQQGGPPSQGYGQYPQSSNYSRSQGMQGYGNMPNSSGYNPGMGMQTPHMQGSSSGGSGMHGPGPQYNMGMNRVPPASMGNSGSFAGGGYGMPPQGGSSVPTTGSSQAPPANSFGQHSPGMNSSPAYKAQQATATSMSAAQIAAQAAVMAAANTAGRATATHSSFPQQQQQKQGYMPPPQPQQLRSPATTAVTQSITTPVTSASVVTTSASNDTSTAKPATPSEQTPKDEGQSKPEEQQDKQQQQGDKQQQQQQQQAPAPADQQPPHPPPPPVKRDNSSQPPTPSSTNIPVASPVPASPGGASMSSFPDDMENNSNFSSPGWPKTPSSPRNNQSQSPMPPEQMLKMYDSFGEDMERKVFLDTLVAFWEERGFPSNKAPSISNKLVDLYRLYFLIKEKGGFVEASKNKQWRDVCQAINIGSSTSAASSLRKNYIKYLLPFECKHDRGDVNPQVLVAATDNSKKSSSMAAEARRLAASPGMAGMPMMDRPPSQQHPMMNSMMEGHHDGNMLPPDQQMVPPTSGPNMMPPGSMGNAGMMPPGSQNSISVRDPFADDYQKPSMPQQNSMNPNMPPYMNQNDPMNRGGMNMPEQYRNAPYQNDPYAMNRRPPVQGNDPFAARRGGMVNDSYGQPRMGQNMPQYPGYGPQFERERFEQQNQTPNMPDQPPAPSHPNMIPPHGQTPQEPGMYPPRYGQQPSQQPMQRQPPHDGYTPPYQGPPQGQNPYPQQQGMYHQGYPQKRPANDMYVPPPKRPEFMNKEDPYGMGYSGQRQPHFSQPGFGTPERPMPGQHGYPQQFREGPMSGPMAPHTPQHMMGPNSHSMGDRPSHGPWPNRSESGFPYPGGQAPPGPHHGMNQREDFFDQRQVRDPSQPHWPPMSRHQPGSHPFPQSSSAMSHHMPSSFSAAHHPPLPPHTTGPGSPSLLARQLQSRMSPHRDKAFLSQRLSSSKMPPVPGMGAMQQRREMQFPPDSVEATHPILVKRKRLTSRDLGPVEAWRIMMALKSGLLAEATWALDTLNILLFDDNTVTYFNLQHLPGMIETLMEHFRRCLISIFGILQEYEVGDDKQICPLPPEEKKKRDKLKALEKKEKEDKKDEEELDMGPNNLKRASSAPVVSPFDRKPIKVVKKVEEVLTNPRARDWDLKQEFESGKLHWEIGGGDDTSHIIAFFDSKGSILRRWHRSDSLEDEDSRDSCGEAKENEDENDNKIKQEKVAGTQPRVTAMLDDMLTVKSEGITINAKASENGDDSEEANILAKKRKKVKVLEDEPRSRDEFPLNLLTSQQDQLARRCICISNIFRSLSFIPGNDLEMSKHPGLLLALGKLLLLHHNHPERSQAVRTYEKDESEIDAVPYKREEWWWDCLELLRENVLVILANIAGNMDLSIYPESISLPILDGLLHWTVCPAACAVDPFATVSEKSQLSPQRLALEALAKLSILDNNVDLIQATPPFSRLEKLNGHLVRWLGDKKQAVMREFSVVLLSNLAQGDTITCRAIACQAGSVSALIGFLEDAEATASAIAQNPRMMQMSHNQEIGTSPDMMRRAAVTLVCLTKVPENRALFVQHESRVLTLSMSHVFDQQILGHLSETLFYLSKES
ncbi:AT-rich interactive domain-containing protein 1B-like isoform X1 [Branchiostoma floridae x Branchiostoma japonicum]